MDADSIPALRTVSQHPDLLVFRPALALLARISTSEAAAALLEILADSHREALADRRLKEAPQGFRALVPELLVRLKGAAREDLVLHLVQTLGAVAAIETAQPLLDMLHSGQSPRLQLAVAQALGGLRTPETALALCAKADDIKLPALHVVAVEALAGACREPWGPMPPEGGPALAEQVRRAWNDRSPWAARLQVVQVLQGVDLDAPAVWQDLAGLVNEALGEKRSPTAWTADELHQVQAAAREFARRGSAQG